MQGKALSQLTYKQLLIVLVLWLCHVLCQNVWRHRRFPRHCVYIFPAPTLPSLGQLALPSTKSLTWGVNLKTLGLTSCKRGMLFFLSSIYPLSKPGLASKEGDCPPINPAIQVRFLSKQMNFSFSPWQKNAGPWSIRITLRWRNT